MGADGAGKGGYVRGLMALAIGFLLLAPAFTVQATDAVRVGHAPTPRTEPKLGRTAATAAISLALPLVTDKVAGDAFVSHLYDPTSSDFHHYLTPRQFTDRFVDPAARRDVSDYLTGQGLKVTSGDTGSLVTAEGTAAQAERAFGVTLSDYRAADGRQFYAADAAPALPAPVASRIHGVLGLDTVAQAHPHAVERPAPTPGDTPAVTPRTPTGCAPATSLAARTGSFTPNQLATAYDVAPLYAAGNHGEGQTIALFELDDYLDTDIATFQSCFGTNVPVARIVNGFAPALGTGQEEVELDIEIAAGIAPQSAQILVYEAQNSFANATQLYQRIANDNTARTVSTSWGLCEVILNTSDFAAYYAIFQQMAAQGMSMFVASGDSGSQGCGNGDERLSADYPAVEPYVTSVGGTALTLTGNDLIASETVWNESDRAHGATGGGISGFYSRPDYQSGGAALTANRTVPDVAADADPYTGYVIYTYSPSACPAYTGNTAATTCYLIVGGTSASAPLWASAAAIINQTLIARGGVAFGFANAALYGVWQHAPTAFHDITSGNNCYRNGTTCASVSPPDYPATVGFDLVSGLGSLDAAAIVDAIVPPLRIAQVNTATGPNGGGSMLTISGSNFALGATVTLDGHLATAMTVVNANTITARTPADPGVVGPVVVVVRNPNGQTATLANGFTYTGPLLASLSYATAYTTGGAVLSINGTGFQSGAYVTLSDAFATNAHVTGSTQITFTVPAHPQGLVNVTVTNPDGSAATLPNALQYIRYSTAPISSIPPVVNAAPHTIAPTAAATPRPQPARHP